MTGYICERHLWILFPRQGIERLKMLCQISVWSIFHDRQMVYPIQAIQALEHWD